MSAPLPSAMPPEPPPGQLHWLPRADPQAPGAAPLAGVRVLDFSELLPGPFLTQALVELGADVLKLERPPAGDPVRRLSPGLFAAVNRGKRCVQVDLKQPAAREAVARLADTADVLVCGFRPGVADRLGLGAEAMLARQPGLVHVSITGYGETGPRAHWPGHDINYLAAAGIAALALGPNGEPPNLGVPMADLNGAVYALAAVNAALLQRARTGRGQALAVSLTDCALHWMNVRLPVLRQQASAGRPGGVPPRAAYGVFTCRDGGQLSVAALETHFWQALVRTLPMAPFDDPRYDAPAVRAAEAPAINARLAAGLAAQDLPEALARLVAADVPVAEVALHGQLHTDAQTTQRGLWVDSGVGPLCRFPVALAGQVSPPGEAPALATA